MLDDFSTVVAVDERHLAELAISLPTWEKFKPQLFSRPFIVIRDAGVTDAEIATATRGHATKIVECTPGVWGSQREKMLSQFVLNAPFEVETPYFLKIDSDAIATDIGLFDRRWFDHEPAFVASPWGYTKPADAIQRLDDWADGNAWLRDKPRLNIIAPPDSASVRHRRVISHVYFGRTDWHRDIALMAGHRLPVPSQDTYCWFVAERLRRHYVRAQMKDIGWRHVSGGLDKLRRAAADAMKGSPAGVVG